LKVIAAALAALLINSAAATEWQLKLTRWHNAELDEAPVGEAAVHRRENFAALRWPLHERQILSFQYSYQPVLIRTGEPATNGHMHLVNAGYAYDDGAMRAEVRTGLHVSSNMFKHNDYHGDAWVTTFAVARGLRHRWLDDVGIAGDYRFDGFRIYPTLSRQFDRDGDVGLLVRLPVELALQPGSERWRLRIYRYGEKWGTLDRDRETEARFYLSEWRLEGGWQLPIGGDGLGIGIDAGLSFDTRARYRDLELAGTVTRRLAPSPYAAVHVHRIKPRQ
jgi:hypothetical protein